MYMYYIYMLTVSFPAASCKKVQSLTITDYITTITPWFYQLLLLKFLWYCTAFYAWSSECPESWKKCSHSPTWLLYTCLLKGLMLIRSDENIICEINVLGALHYVLVSNDPRSI